MRINPIQLQSKQALFNDYKNDFSNIADKFEYDPKDTSIWERRMEHLRTRSYQRDALTDVLIDMNKRWNAPESTISTIEKLRDEESSVVIAGQQAGLLTGPLYTVNKIISVLQLAKQRQKESGRPVLPVFWIAGEDHDFDEINHLMMKSEGKMKKISIGQTPESKASVSEVEINKSSAEQWVKDIFGAAKEAEYTSEFYEQVQMLLEESETYSDFFAKLVYRLFPDEGLIIVDAHDPKIRKLESPYFSTMIENNESIAGGVFAALQVNRKQGYEMNLDSDLDDAHIFYHDNGDRILLMRQENGSYRGKNNELTLSEQELKETAEQLPERLSNNVVTRPLMQEFLFPVLAFIGGPGEINYWSALKPAFRAVDLEMPPVFPRLSFTFIDRKSEQHLERLQIDASEAIRHGVGEEKMNWLASRSAPPIHRLSEQVKEEIDRIHRPLREKSSEFGPDLEQMAEKNLDYIFKQIDFLEKRMNQSLEQHYEHEVAHFNDLDLLLHPSGGLQERVWGIVPWVTLYGTDLFCRVNEHTIPFHEDHFIVYV
ncbi:bacillithiol biosynthesis cysteine-adding enzyme BshC [Halobacillus yeomjeoni]|uniref:Putative cysteine ligase BshC n=1 Tax=Halobacillus yeomjeoni TaxID=311194 RepID=A0A931HSZ8_9BACI|nr:bacillithiol biosynthesis cysteine-adding enzyme BshC [Halobacillus yeomjeoni]MBH0229044.1 bacillithiol biosynthesis cysteine-adding enzyme BshC [Halobacillus yeomjeoni]